ncbi:MAG: hypothetical protein IMW89_17660, partial [Ktedonobacteraceae bacterium]|nr:hypothetical protein [Ktedonobacteraceae bacterium]
GQHTLTLVRVAGGQQTQLLSDTATATADHSPGPATLPATGALLQPVSNNIWFTDSRQFLFLTRDRLLWQGQTLSGGKGLYTVAIDDAGKVQGKPISVAHGNITQAGWIYQDPNTSFLY